jgi:hypothetical protein
MVHIVQSWDKSNVDPKKPDANVTIQVYSDAPSVELFVNAQSVGKQELHSVAPALAAGDTWAKWDVPSLRHHDYLCQFMKSIMTIRALDWLLFTYCL